MKRSIGYGLEAEWDCSGTTIRVSAPGITAAMPFSFDRETADNLAAMFRTSNPPPYGVTPSTLDANTRAICSLTDALKAYMRWKGVPFC